MVLGKQIKNWVFAREKAAFCNRFRIANRLVWRMPIAVDWHDGLGCYEISDIDRGGAAPPEPERLFLARRQRVFRYRRGVADRVSRLAGKYFIDRVPIENGDTVIDCGANIGEVGRYLRQFAEVNYIAVEPSGPEAAACDANNFDRLPHTHRMAMWRESGTLPFFDSNATGDSSLIEPATHTNRSTVPTTTLRRFVEENKIGPIKLLKIDGEGAEPEILEGAADVMGQVAFCTIDAGPERGVSELHVIPQVCNFMAGQGFELLDVNLDRQIFFFRNAAQPNG